MCPGGPVAIRPGRLVRPSSSRSTTHTAQGPRRCCCCCSRRPGYPRLAGSSVSRRWSGRWRARFGRCLCIAAGLPGFLALVRRRDRACSSCNGAGRSSVVFCRRSGNRATVAWTARHPCRRPVVERSVACVSHGDPHLAPSATHIMRPAALQRPN
ncbi:hypothetical protein BDV95DRAFT_284669 [Massariosphaeria phaeospora]|uniref:Uncharacterized protein n=1 Tax=Massariosphaeria phaeospora TaxID=100035 RepID=A0A7C8MSH7_9PLEO|nr:hypothetical protein BDV95DRAFT_284669 [Massariosphaeria phaeospora]